MAINSEGLVKLLSGFTGMNKGRPQGNPTGFSEREAGLLAAYLTDHQTDFVEPDAPRVKEKWYAIDGEIGQDEPGWVTSGDGKRALVTAWQERYGVDSKVQTMSKFFPAGVAQGDADQGQVAYRYIAPAGLTGEHKLLVVHGDSMDWHLRDLPGMADAVRAAAASTTEASTTAA